MKDIIEIGRRIKKSREEKGLTQEELGLLLGLNKSTIQRYETGKISRIKLPVLESIAEELGVNPEYLALEVDSPIDYSESEAFKNAPLDAIEHFNGNAEMVYKFMEAQTKDRERDNLISRFDNIKPIKLKRFPLLGKIACGEPIFADEDKESFIMADTDIQADFCLTAKGDSMINARINDGDVVFIKEMPMVENGEIAAVIIENEATLKRVYYYPDKNKLMLVAENPAFEPLVYLDEELDTIRILGKAVCFMSAL